MSQDRQAAITATEVEIGQRFADYGIPNPEETAAKFLRWLQTQGWRCYPALARDDSRPTKADPDVQRAAVESGKAAVEAARRARQASQSCECRGMDEVPGCDHGRSQS